MSLPWDKSPNLTVGIFARNQGAFIPERVISSAKSWLAHSGVNRRGKILPWGSNLGQQMLSPLQASFQYLNHIKNAWDARFAQVTDKDGTPCRLAEQTVTVTVPASFDETARKLTLEAAEMAGLRHVTLLEEPLAAFYSFLAHNANWQDMVQRGACVLVVDVGGGTSDFSIIQMEEGNTLRRTAVGDHLLLGGDNMDMTLARMVESDSGKRLTQRQWAQLCHECRLVKEKLLSEGGPDTAEARLTGQGSSLFANSIGRKFARTEVEKIILDGFF
ncbi:MAG: Hsp70 family protein, partial [Victivallales bacterium]|nr:Hsp70 family protein [Victivallales bacterium]